MKIIILLSVSLLLSLSFYAQITISRSDFIEAGDEIPRINYEFEVAPIDFFVTNPPVFTEIEGANFFIDSLRVFDPTTFDETGVFPEATCAYVDEFMGGLAFMRLTDNEAELLGFFIDLDVTIADLKFDQPLSMYSFPIEYEDEFSSQTAGRKKLPFSVLQPILGSQYALLAMQFDSIMIDINVDFLSKFDEFGTMVFQGPKVLNGDFSYLRENQRVISTIDMFLRSKLSQTYVQFNQTLLGTLVPDAFPMIDTACTYLYWTNDKKYPMTELVLNTSLDSVTNISLRYDPLNTVGIGCINVSKLLNGIVYPNPTSDFVNFGLENYLGCELQVYTIDGSLINKQMINEETLKLDVSSYKSGNYFYKVLDKNASAVAGGKFIKN